MKLDRYMYIQLHGFYWIKSKVIPVSCIAGVDPVVEGGVVLVGDGEVVERVVVGEVAEAVDVVARLGVLVGGVVVGEVVLAGGAVLAPVVLETAVLDVVVSNAGFVVVVVVVGADVELEVVSLPRLEA